MDSSHDTEQAVDSNPPLETVTAEEVEIMMEQDSEGSDAGLSEEGDDTPDPDQSLTKALDDLREAEQRAKTAHQSYLRAVADLDNYRKRMRRERDNIVVQAVARTVGSLLPVLDSFDAALGLQAESEQGESVLSGMRATYDLLLGTLQNQGLEIISTAGEEFSPRVHEPINAPPPGEGDLIVADEVRRGYRLKGRLLRAALVMVTRRSESG